MTSGVEFQAKQQPLGYMPSNSKFLTKWQIDLIGSNLSLFLFSFIECIGNKV